MRGQTSYWPFLQQFKRNDIISKTVYKWNKNPKTFVQATTLWHWWVQSGYPLGRPAFVLCPDIIRKRTVDCGKKGSQVQIGTYQLTLHPNFIPNAIAKEPHGRVLWDKFLKGKLRCGDKNKNLFVRRHKDDIKLIRRANSLGLWFARGHTNQWQNCVYNVCRLN